MRVWIIVLACLIIISCASDGQFYKTELFNGDYEEVAFELSYDVSFQENGEMYGNYKLGMLALYKLYPSKTSMEYVIEDTDFEDVDPDTLYWSQDRIAKEFFLKSSIAGFTPAMTKLSGLINIKDSKRFGDSFSWLVNAASLGNLEALETLRSREVDTKDLVVASSIKSNQQIALAKEIDFQFSNHNPVLAARRKLEAEEQMDEAFASFGKVILTAAAIALAVEVLPDSDDSLRTRNRKTSIIRGFAEGLNGSDTGYAWDAFYNQYNQIIWRCRNKSNGQFARNINCNGKTKRDNTWPDQ